MIIDPVTVTLSRHELTALLRAVTIRRDHDTVERAIDRCNAAMKASAETNRKEY